MKWAQRHDIVYVSMELPNITETKFDVDESNSRLTFSGKVDGDEYGLDMLLFGQVVKEKSVFNTVGREVILTVAKKGLDAPWWPRLIAETGKNAKIAIDWSRWRDSDEEADDSKVMMSQILLRKIKNRKWKRRSRTCIKSRILKTFRRKTGPKWTEVKSCILTIIIIPFIKSQISSSSL